MILDRQQTHVELNRNQQNKLDRKLNKKLPSDVCFNRNYSSFFTNLLDLEPGKIQEKFELIYAQILFNYFSDEEKASSLINRFLKLAFSVNLPMNKVIEIHLEVINGLEHQLMLESLNTQYLTDYRLALIDVIAQLGEIYRSAVCENS